MFILFSALAMAADIQVGNRSITQTVASSKDGDRLILSPKPYKGCIDLNGKSLSFISDGGAIIDGGGRCPFSIVANKGETLTLSGLTIKNAKMGGISLQNREGTLNIDNVSFAQIGGSRSKSSAIRISGGEAYIANSRFNSNTSQKGGAIYADKGARLLVYKSLFSQNIAQTGAAIYGVDKVSIEIRSSRFVSNQTRSGGIGGAIAVRRNATLRVVDSRFQNNRSQGLAGAIYVQEDTTQGRCDLRIDKSVFHGNSASFGTGAGGAIYVRDQANVIVKNTKFNQNKAANHGGAIYLYDLQGQANIQDSQFSNNQSRSGGGGAIYASARANLRKVQLNIANTQFKGNSAATYGGAVSMGDTINATGDVTLSKVVFKQNKAKSSRSGVGGAVYMNGSQPSRFKADEVEFTNNLAELAGGGLYVNGTGVVTLNAGRFLNNKAEGASNISARYGGAMMVARSNRFSLSDSFFCNNKVQHRGGKNGPDSTGGGFYGQQLRDATIRDVAFLENQSQRFGGGLGMLDIGELKIDRLSLLGGQAFNGGGAYFKQSTWNLHNSLIAYSQLGGGIESETDAKAMSNNVFYENTGGNLRGSISWKGATDQNPGLKKLKIDGRCNDKITGKLSSVGAK